MNTFILKWNPVISSYGMDRLNEDFYFGKKKILEDENPWGFDWSVWNYEKAHEGDRFFMLKVGEGENNGIVMSGIFFRATRGRRLERQGQKDLLYGYGVRYRC